MADTFHMKMKFKTSRSNKVHFGLKTIGSIKPIIQNYVPQKMKKTASLYTLLYISENLNFKPRKDLEIFE